MRKLLTFPTWLFVKLTKKYLPDGHIFKEKQFTLADWANNSTPLNDFFSIIFWVSIPMFLAGVIFFIKSFF